MNRNVLTGACAGVVAVSTLLAGCDGTASGEGGDTIKIMTIAPTGTPTVNFETAKVVEAYADQLNDHGGLDGKKVEVIACNDKFDPNEAVNCAREAVQEKVVAVVGGLSAFSDQIIPILEQAKIPWIGTSGLTAPELSSEYSWVTQGGPMVFIALGGAAAQGCKTTGAVILDTPAAEGILAFAEQAMAPAGKKIEDIIKVPQTAVDLSSTAEAMSDLDCAVVALPAAQVAPLLAAKQQLGVTTRLFLSGASLDGKTIADNAAAMEGTFYASSFSPLDDPAWDDARAAVKPLDLDSSVLENSWVAMRVFEQVASGIDGAITATSLVDALGRASKVDTGGMTPTLDLTQELPVPEIARIFNTNVQNYVVQDGKSVPQGEFVDLGAALAGQPG